MKRRRCAICDITNNTTQLCDACRKDPANAHWVETDEAVAVEHVDTLIPQCRLAQLQGRAIRPVPPRQAQILQLVHSGRTHEEVRNRGKGRRRQPTRTRSRPMTLAEVARTVGCTRQYVQKVIRDTLK